MIRGIVFDIDGTLIDSVDAHSAAWHEAFAAFGMDVSQADIRAQTNRHSLRNLEAQLRGIRVSKKRDKKRWKPMKGLF